MSSNYPPGVTGNEPEIAGRDPFIFKGVIRGSYVSMKNGRRAARINGRSAFIKKQKALDWEELAMLQVRYRGLPYEGEVALVATFYYDNVQADLDENLLKDMLQRKKPGKPCLGVIKNDSQVKKHDTDWKLDKVDPRVEFTIMDLDTYWAWRLGGDAG